MRFFCFLQQIILFFFRKNVFLNKSGFQALLVNTLAAEDQISRSASPFLCINFKNQYFNMCRFSIGFIAFLNSSLNYKRFGTTEDSQKSKLIEIWPFKDGLNLNKFCPNLRYLSAANELITSVKNAKKCDFIILYSK